MSSSVFRRLVQEAVAQHVDPWADKGLEKLPAEKVTRYTYIPAKGVWQTDVSLIKMESQPFDRGAQRQVYRMKKISQAPTAHWKKDPLDWKKAPNYVVKCYITPDGTINANNNREQCFQDVQIQYEASYWAALFNKAGPPKHIKVIQCNVLELTGREGHPVVGCERFVDGHDKHGAGFVKHNSNSGFVDDNQSRSTPQAFSAHSFYESQGKYMVVDIQGVGDLYTDPQIHSQSTKFGHSDLGVRGMALFFVSFRRNPVCDAVKLPRFPLSSRERDRIHSGSQAGSISRMTGLRENESGTIYAEIANTSTKADMLKLEKVLAANPKFSALSISEQRLHVASSMTERDLQEVEAAILAAHNNAKKVQQALHSGDWTPSTAINVEKTRSFLYDQFVKFKESATPSWTAGLQKATAEVHLEVAVLEAAGRFSTNEGGASGFDDVADVSSCLFHLCEASLLGSCAAALALGRLRAGLGTALLEILGDYVAVDQEAALSFYQLSAVRGSVVGAWQAAQILSSSGEVKEAAFMHELVLVLMGVMSVPDADARELADSETDNSFRVGDRVEGNYCGCGTWYEASVLEKIAQGDGVTVYFIKYTEDGEVETVSADNIRQAASSSSDISTVSEVDGNVTATGVISEGSQPPLVGKYSGTEYKPKLSIGDDGSFVPEVYEVYAALGDLYATLENNESACQYFNDAAESAMEAGKPKLANKYVEQAATYE